MNKFKEYVVEYLLLLCIITVFVEAHIANMRITAMREEMVKVMKICIVAARATTGRESE